MRRPGWLLAAAVVALLAGTAPTTLARFTSAADATASFATGSLRPPTALAATGGAVVTLGWTPTTSVTATGYTVLRSATSGSGYAVAGTVTPATLSGTTDSPGNGTWFYVLRTFLASWASADSNEASATVSTGTTGFQPCDPASNAADTGGDGDGYEGSPGSGCLADGTYATDAGSGTNTTASCANTGKDRHRFWGYAFGLPATVTSVGGIEVQLEAGLNNNGGTTLTCVELSWDGGATWTAARQLSFTGAALATYTLGSATDTWGHAWTAAELGTASFRVRLTDATSQPTKTFRLDGLSVQVHFTP